LQRLNTPIILSNKVSFEHLDYEKIKIHRFSNSKKKKNIFVSIASYRDEQLEPTLLDLYAKAKYPDQIRSFCLMQQSNEDSFNINLNTTFLNKYSIDFGEIDASISKGVCWARAFCQEQQSNETYFLQIDSHMRFAQDWDETLIKLLYDTNDAKAVISCYPPAYTPDNINLIPSIVYNKPVEFEYNHSPKLKGQLINSDEEYEQNKLHQWISAGFFFTYTNFCKEVPYDPYHYFIGEEIDLTTRAYTRNWNSYAPKVCLIWHYYFIKDVNTRILHWEENKNWIRLCQLSDERVKFKLKIVAKETCDIEALQNIQLFQLGEDRTLEQFEQDLGINFKRKRIIE
jgi:hypothetical protein